VAITAWKETERERIVVWADDCCAQNRFKLAVYGDGCRSLVDDLRGVPVKMGYQNGTGARLGKRGCHLHMERVIRGL